MSIINLFIAAGRAIAEWRCRKRAFAELMALDDRSLADIGIRRSQIRALVEGDRVPQIEAERGALPGGAGFWSAQTRLHGLSTRAGL